MAETTLTIAVTQLRKAIKALDPKVSLRKGVKLENMVTRADLGATLDLAAIAAAGPGADYDPARVAGGVMRLDEPSASFILFRSGIVVVTDVSSETRARSALKALSKFLHAASLIG